jgi:hypothetical protein
MPAQAKAQPGVRPILFYGIQGPPGGNYYPLLSQTIHIELPVTKMGDSPSKATISVCTAQKVVTTPLNLLSLMVSE